MNAQFAAQVHFHIVRSTGLQGLRQRSESIALIWVIIIMGAFNGLVLYISLVWADTQSMVLGCALSCFFSISAFLRFLSIYQVTATVFSQALHCSQLLDMAPQPVQTPLPFDLWIFLLFAAVSLPSTFSSF